jgi:hypothetical protein
MPVLHTQHGMPSYCIRPFIAQRCWCVLAAAAAATHSAVYTLTLLRTTLCGCCTFAAAAELQVRGQLEAARHGEAATQEACSTLEGTLSKERASWANEREHQRTSLEDVSPLHFPATHVCENHGV